MGWFGPQTGDCSCCAETGTCAACDASSQPPETFRVVIPSGDHGAGTYTLGDRNIIGQNCTWHVDPASSWQCQTPGWFWIGPFTRLILSLETEIVPANTTLNISWSSYGLEQYVYRKIYTGLAECAGFSSESISVVSGLQCTATNTGPALVTAL